jgi:phosphoglycolate phosphatase
MLLERFSMPYDLLLTRDDVRWVKPDPRHLSQALRRLARSPEHALLVGDHWMDIQAGRRAGCSSTIGILGDHNANWFDPCPPDHVVKDLQSARNLCRFTPANGAEI